MTDWISPSWLVEALVASSVLMVVVLLLRRPVRKAFGADVAYGLWLLPVLRLALPPLPAAWHEAAVAPVLRATEQMSVLLIDPVGEGVSVATPSYAWLAPVLALLWIVGAGGFVVWHALVHHRFCRRMLDQAASHEDRDGVRVIETAAASGPLAFGIWRRYVAFPRDFAERFEAEERDLALAHELGHHARGDLIANWVALVVLALHWFNPIAWRAFRAFRADQEIANDARVLAGMNPMRRHTYACAILKAAHPTFLGGTVSATCHLHTIDDLKGRLKMLTTIRMSRTRLIAGSGVLGLCVAAGLGLTASGTAAAAKVRSTVEHATGVDLASLDQAVPSPDDAHVLVVPPASAKGPVTVAETDPAPVAVTAPPRTRAHVVQDDGTGPDQPSVPDVPPPPSGVVAAIPPAPPEPPMIAQGAPGTTTTVTVTKDGKRIVHYSRYVKLDRDGNATFVGETMPVPPRPPEVVSRPCGSGGDAKRMVLNVQQDGHRRIIVCTDRIAAAAAKGAVIAANSKTMERDAYARALDGLRASRARMMANADMTGTQRQDALAEIDTAIAELEADLARAR
jgi:bla regulator protein BlaR1